MTTDGKTETHNFFYDNSGTPYAMQVDGTTYYYITNLQGDVMELVDANGNTVASYTYSPYGKVLTAEGALAETNPLRYRGYYYDSESGLYYLQSRYYDPNTGRFINADSYAGTGQGVLGYNMFAYCNNNPIIAADPDGRWLHLVIGAVVGASIGGICAAIQGKSGTEIAIAAGAGALSGLLASTGLGIAAQIVGSATISAGESYLSQGVTKGFDRIDYTEVAYSGAVGAITGASGGVSKSVSKHLWKQSSVLTSRIAGKLSTKGFSAALSELAPAAKYYFSQTSTLFYKPLVKEAIRTISRSVQRRVGKACIIEVE